MPDIKPTPEMLIRRFSLQPHIENGAFVERHYENAEAGRAESGLIYYYVAPDELTQFHVIDCDEYWCYVAGSPLDIWLLDPDGTLSVQRLGIAEGCEPAVFVRRGVAFASRHTGAPEEGTFLSCVTVPRFSYEGFRMFDREEMIACCPQTAAFYE